MHTVLVKYRLPKPVPRATMLEGFKAAEERFRNLPVLIRKYFCYDEANHTGHSVYLLENEAAAKKSLTMSSLLTSRRNLEPRQSSSVLIH